VSFDNPTSNAITRQALGWQPEHGELLTDIRESEYFA
jgi:hypothetical protein